MQKPWDKYTTSYYKKQQKKEGRRRFVQIELFFGKNQNIVVAFYNVYVIITLYSVVYYIY